MKEKFFFMIILMLSFPFGAFAAKDQNRCSFLNNQIVVNKQVYKTVESPLVSSLNEQIGMDCRLISSGKRQYLAIAVSVYIRDWLMEKVLDHRLEVFELRNKSARHILNANFSDGFTLEHLNSIKIIDRPKGVRICLKGGRDSAKSLFDRSFFMPSGSKTAVFESDSYPEDSPCR